jgi:hypothetical protein
MITKILPVISSFAFGNADAVLLRSVADNLTTSATFFWQLGRTVPATPEIPATEDAPAVPASPESFESDDNAIGNVELSGDAYAGWSGANDELPALLLPLIGPGLSPAQ